MNTILQWLEAGIGELPLPLLEVWGRFAYVVGFALAIFAFGGFTFRPGGKWGIGRERQAWDAKAVLSIPVTFLLIIITGYLGSFIVLVPGAQTLESAKDLMVLLCIVLFGYPALITVPFAYALSDLIEGVPPEFILDWLPGYFINPACFWIAYQFIGKNPDFRRGRTWGMYLVFVMLFLAVEPVLWGYICSGKFTPAISYRQITSALFFTTGLTWLAAPVAMLAAYPLARKLGMFWAEIPGHVKERTLGGSDWIWEAGAGDARPEGSPATAAWPIRMVLLAPFIALTLLMVGATAYVTLRSAEDDANKLASRLHQEISENINLQLDEHLADRTDVNVAAISALLRQLPVSQNGLALIVDRAGKTVASSVATSDAALDPVAARAIAELNALDPSPEQIHAGTEFRFDHVTAKPLARTTWLTHATAYQDRQGGHADWIVLTIMPESYYLAGVQTGNSRSAMIFALALVLSLAVAALLASIVTGRLRQMSLVTKALAHGDLMQRMPGSRMEELNVLSHSFNNMADQLKTSFDDLLAEVEMRRRRERELERRDLIFTTESRILGMIVADAPLTEILTAIVQGIETIAQGTIASILLLDDDGVHVRLGAAPSLPEAYNHAIDGAAIGPNAGSCGVALFRRESVVVTDIETDPLWADYRELARAHNLRACWSTPIIDARGNALGSFAMYYCEPRSPSEDDLVLIRRATHLAGVALERQQSENENRRLQNQFHQAQKMEAVGHLAGGVAHDFNNLLTVISGCSEVLLAKLKSADNNRTAVKQILLASERAAALTGQLLALSRKSVLQPKVLDINDVIKDTESLLRRLIGEDIELSIVLDAKLARIKVDPSQVGQVLMNLAVNARDAMPQGGKLAFETRNVHIDDDYRQQHPDAKPGWFVQISATDAGCGMTPEVRARIFEPFFTTKGVGKGTGLGLAMIYGIVRQSGGHIEVDSEVGVGTTFKLFFRAVDEQITFHADASLDAPIRHGSETILLAEDESAVRDLAMDALESHGYQVLVAVDGADALRVVHEHPAGIDMLVTDVVMPGLSGRELAETLRKKFPSLRILYVSGYTDDAVVRYGLLRETVNFLQKPYTPLMLARRVREILDAPPSPPDAI